jgi:hypothetical protein
MAGQSELDKQRIITILEKYLTRQEFESSLLLWNQRRLSGGVYFQAGNQEIQMPFDGTVVFVDLHPGANFAHPCKYVQIDLTTGNAVVTDASLPPKWASESGVLRRPGKQKSPRNSD